MWAEFSELNEATRPEERPRQAPGTEPVRGMDMRLIGEGHCPRCLERFSSVDTDGWAVCGGCGLRGKKDRNGIGMMWDEQHTMSEEDLRRVAKLGRNQEPTASGDGQSG